MGNSTKNNQLSSFGFKALYDFPDLSPNDTDGQTPSPGHSHFIKGAAIKNSIDTQAPDVQPAPEDSSQTDPESDHVRTLIEEAYNKGLDQGRSETMVAQQEKVEQATVALKTAIEEFSRLRRQDVERMESETVRLALAIAKKIIGNEVSHENTIAHVVKMAMRKVSDPRYLTLRLNPKDVETVEAFKGDLVAEDDLAGVFQVEADESILQGGCIIETKLGDVDARIDQQIRIIEEQLIAQIPK